LLHYGEPRILFVFREARKVEIMAIDELKPLD